MKFQNIAVLFKAMLKSLIIMSFARLSQGILSTIVASLAKITISWFNWLAQLVECRATVQEVVGSKPRWTNTWGTSITEEKVLVRLASLLG